MANPGWIFKFVTDQNILVFHKATLPHTGIIILQLKSILRLFKPEFHLSPTVWIHRGYYMVVQRYEFCFRVAKQYFTNERSEWVKYCFCHLKIKFISSSRRVMFFLWYRQKDVDKIIEGNDWNYVIDKLICIDGISAMNNIVITGIIPFYKVDDVVDIVVLISLCKGLAPVLMDLLTFPVSGHFKCWR